MHPKFYPHYVDGCEVTAAFGNLAMLVMTSFVTRQYTECCGFTESKCFNAVSRKHNARHLPKHISVMECASKEL